LSLAAWLLLWQLCHNPTDCIHIGIRETLPIKATHK
jgi:hypothetical protein